MNDTTDEGPAGESSGGESPGDEGAAQERSRRGRDTSILSVAGIGVALAAHNMLVHKFLPRQWHTPMSVVTTGVALGLTKAAGATLDEVGLGPTSASKGLKTGAAASGAISAGIAVAMLTPMGRSYLARSAQGSGRKRRIAYDTVIRIPWLTAAFEEVLFRGALYGLLERRFSPAVALGGSAAAFAAWHVLPALPGAGGPQDTWEKPRPIVAVSGSLVVTGVAGLIFGGLRAQSGSVMAPFLAHSATNSGAYVAAQMARAHQNRPKALQTVAGRV